MESLQAVTEKSLNYHGTGGHHYNAGHSKCFQSTKVKERGQMLHLKRGLTTMTANSGCMG